MDTDINRLVNISSNGTSAVLLPLIATGAPYPPIELTHFNPESDIVATNDLETGEALLTPDGKILHYGKNAMIEVTISIGSNTYAADVLSTFLAEQSRKGKKPSIVNAYQLSIVTGYMRYVYVDGTLVSGTVTPTIGNEYIQHSNYTFKFAHVHRLMEL